MTTASPSLAPAHLDSLVALRLLGVTAAPLGLRLVLTIARSALDFLNHGSAILAVAIFVWRTRR
jgi:hypothetical protein